MASRVLDAAPADTVPAPTSTTTTTSTTAASTTDPRLQAIAALDEVVPPGRFGSESIAISMRGGNTSLTWDNPPRIEVARAHTQDPAKLRFVMAHEWGHHVALRYGNAAAGFGYPPADFDAGGQDPAEKWGNCVAEFLVDDFWMGTHGLSRCTADQLGFVAAFLAAGQPS